MLGVYVHIPFCKNICTYCDFCKMYYDSKYIDKYLYYLSKEIDERYKGEYVDSIYIGGGTPSCLSYDELSKLFNILNRIKLKDNYEYTIECNIENIDEDKLKLFRDNKINRISYGVESFDDECINILGRRHNKELVFNNIKLSKKYFSNINIDLIYGVNNNIDTLKKDISYFLELDIPHVSCYSLIIEEHTKLYIDKHKYIDEDIDKDMFDYINDTLTNSGYNHYELSNYAKDGYESIHNKNYWLNGSYYGFGLGAVSYLDYYRISNTKNLSKYLDGEYIYESNYEDTNIRKENDLILGFRLIDGIDISLFNNRYNCDIINNKVIKELIDEDYLNVDNGYLKCNYKYFYTMNYILEKIMGSEL